MTDSRQTKGAPGQDPDGIRVVRSDAAGQRRTLVFQALALFFAASCIGYVVMPRSTPARPAPGHGDRGSAKMSPEDNMLAEVREELKKEEAEEAKSKAAGAVGDPAKPAAGAISTRSLTPRRSATKRPVKEESEDEGDPTQQPEFIGIREGDIDAGEYIARLHEMGIKEGIGAFNPPGTSPPLEGLAVPEDFPLPEGYVRHYQSTDDGQSIEPILMFSPDFEFFDENGNPVPIPEDRVVPPELAPPGFPLRNIEIPPKRPPGALGR